MLKPKLTATLAISFAALFGPPALAQRVPVPAEADRVFKSDPREAYRLTREAYVQCVKAGNDFEYRCFVLGVALTEFASASGNAAEGEAIGRLMLRIAERRTGELDDMDVMLAANNLGVLLRKTGRPAESEPFLRRALAITVRVQGPGESTCFGSSRTCAPHWRRRARTPDFSIDRAAT